MEQLALTIGLIQKVEMGQLFLLLQWSQQQQRWRFVSGQRIERESFRDTIIREVAWQLDLDRQRDFVVASVPQLSVESLEQIPGEDREVTMFVQFFCIHLYGRASVEKVEQDPNLKWFTCAEICQGFTHEGDTIEPAIVEWLNKWQVVQPWR
jgi:hypothetical protein